MRSDRILIRIDTPETGPATLLKGDCTHLTVVQLVLVDCPLDDLRLLHQHTAHKPLYNYQGSDC